VWCFFQNKFYQKESQFTSIKNQKNSLNLSLLQEPLLTKHFLYFKTRPPGLIPAKLSVYSAISNSSSSAKHIIGYSKQFWTDFTAGVQYYGEYMQDYNNYEDSLPAGFPKTDQVHQLITVRLTQMLKYNTLRLGLFTFYSPDEEDYFVIPEARYNITDSLWTSIGINIFGGKDSRTFFGQLDKNDNVFAAIRYEF